MKYNTIEIQNSINALLKDLEKEIDINVYREKKDCIIGLVIDYLDENGILEKEMRNLISQYDKLIQTSFKNEIIGMIRKEVRLKYPCIGIAELLHFSIILYMCSTLIAHDVPEEKLVNQIIALNNNFFNIMQNEDKIIVNRKMKKHTLEYLTDIKEKYIKIIKERI